MHLVTSEDELPSAIAQARRESVAFGDGTLLVERFVTRPRHIEVQIFADTVGTVVSLGERECSLQRRHQKIVEEAPSPLLDAPTRAAMSSSAVAAAAACGYQGAGTVEFIVSADQPADYFFMEMNTRLQVEHPVTEAVLDLDLVELPVAGGSRGAPALAEEEVGSAGHAAEARIYAEDPPVAFSPSGVRSAGHPGGSRGSEWTRPCSRERWSAPTTTRCWPRSSPGALTGPPRCTASAWPWAGTRCLGWAPTWRSCAPCWPTQRSGPGGWTPAWPSGTPPTCPKQGRPGRAAARGAGRGGARADAGAGGARRPGRGTSRMAGASAARPRPPGGWRATRSACAARPGPPRSAWTAASRCPPPRPSRAAPWWSATADGCCAPPGPGTRPAGSVLGGAADPAGPARGQRAGRGVGNGAQPDAGDGPGGAGHRGGGGAARGSACSSWRR